MAGIMPACLERNYAILSIICSFIITMLISGVLYSFGVTFPIFQEEFQISATATSWIGSINYAILCGAHPITLRLITRYGLRYIMLVGVFLVAGGILIASFAPHPAVLFLSFNILFGYGCNVLYNTCMGTVSLWYPGTKSSRAFSLTLVAAPIGALAFNPILELMITLYGWRLSFRILTAVFFIMGLGCVAMIRIPGESMSDEDKQNVNIETSILVEKSEPPPKDEKLKPIEEKLDPKNLEKMEKVQKKAKIKNSDEKMLIKYNPEKKNILKSPMLWLWVIENLTIYLGLITPYIHLINFLKMHNISATYGALAVTCISIGEICTRLTSGLLATYFKFHLMHYYPIATALLAAAVFYLSTVTTFNMVIIYSIVTGLASGPISVSSYLIARDLFPDSFHTSWSCTGFGQMIGALLGPPLAGAILDFTGSYKVAFYVTGGLFLFSCVLSTVKCIAYRNTQQQPLNIGIIYKMSPACIESQLVITELVSVV